MNRLVVASLGLLAVATAAWGSCQGSDDECSDSPDFNSLLQQNRLTTRMPPLDFEVGGNGCPRGLRWDGFKMAMGRFWRRTVKPHLPVHPTFSFVRPISYEDCTGTINATAALKIDYGDLKLGKIRCNWATCVAHRGKRCSHFDPMNLTIDFASTNMTIAAHTDGDLSWDAGCPRGPGTKFADAETNFTVASPYAKYTAAVDLSTAEPHTTTLPNVSGVEFMYGNITTNQCSYQGKEVDPLCDAVTKTFETADFKKWLASAIEYAINHIHH